jgi:PadR family transcriptional regulator AphA
MRHREYFISSLGYALLGWLARELLSGYDLKLRMEWRVGNFWIARHSQIYPELVRLEEDGYLTHRVVEQKDRPNKKVYQVSDTGFEILREWVTEPPSPLRTGRDELDLKAYSIWLAEPEGAVTLFREQQRLHEEQLLRYEEIGAWMSEEWSEDLHRIDFPRFASYSALQQGVGGESSGTGHFDRA